MSTMNCRRSSNPANRPASDPPITIARPAGRILEGSVTATTSDRRSWFAAAGKVSNYTLPPPYPPPQAGEGREGATEEFHGLDHVRQRGGAEGPERMAGRAAGGVRLRSLQPKWLRGERTGLGNRQGPGMDHQAQARTAVRLSSTRAQLFLDRHHTVPWPPAPDGRRCGRICLRTPRDPPRELRARRIQGA